MRKKECTIDVLGVHLSLTLNCLRTNRTYHWRGRKAAATGLQPQHHTVMSVQVLLSLKVVNSVQGSVLFNRLDSPIVSILQKVQRFSGDKL